MVFITGPIDLALIAIGVTLVMRALQAKIMGDPLELKERQKKLNQKQKRMLELQKENPEHPKLVKMQQELADEMKPFMKNMMKFMFVGFAVLPVFYFVHSVYAEVTVTLPVVNWTLDWFWWYFLVALSSGLIINKLMELKSKNKNKDKKKVN